MRIENKSAAKISTDTGERQAQPQQDLYLLDLILELFSNLQASMVELKELHAPETWSWIGLPMAFHTGKFTLN